MSRDYLLHGSRHRAMGSDPIPGITGASWIFGSATLISVPSQTSPSTHYDFTASTWYTNDSSIFDVVVGSGVTINGAGFYVAMIECEWAGTDAPTKAAEMVWNISAIGNEIHDASAFLPDFMGGVAITKGVQGFALDAAAPTSGADLALRQTSGSTAVVSMEFSIVRVTDDDGNF